MLPFSFYLFKLLRIDLTPRSTVEYFINLIKRLKDHHEADESVSDSPAEEKKNQKNRFYRFVPADIECKVRRAVMH